MDTKTTASKGAPDPGSTSTLPDDIAELLALGGSTLVSEVFALDDGGQIVFLGKDVKSERLPALNPKLPEFVTQAETFVEPQSFSDYLIQFKSSTAICRASLGQNRIDCVLDYHGNARVKDGTTDRDAAVPGRGKHTATLLCPWDPDYKKWRDILGQPIEQSDLVEFIEDMVHTISEPAAGDLIDAVGSVEISRAVKFKSARSLRNGTVQVLYTEEDGSDGSTTMPEEIKIVTPLFQGGPTAVLTAKLRYAMDKGHLVFRVVVPGIEKEEREAFRSIGEHVRADTATPVFYVA